MPIIEKITRRVRDVIGPNGVVRIEETVDENGNFKKQNRADRLNIMRRAIDITKK